MMIKEQIIEIESSYYGHCATGVFICKGKILSENASAGRTHLATVNLSALYAVNLTASTGNEIKE